MERTSQFPIDNLRRLSRLSHFASAADLALSWGVILVAWGLVYAIPTPLVICIAIVCVSSRQSALGNLAHDAWHRLCLRNRSINDWLGAWAYSYPIGIPYFHDRQRHLMHHRRVGHIDDPDFRNYSRSGRETRSYIVRFLLGRICGSLLWETLWNVVLKRTPRIAVGESSSTPSGHSVLREYAGVTISQLIIAGALSWMIGWWAYPLLWLLPLVTLTACFSSYRAFLEHAAESDDVCPEQRLADIRATWLERLFIAPCHFYLHALHHAYPSIPHYNLSSAKAALRECTGEYPFNEHGSYFSVMRSHLSRRQPANSDDAENRSGDHDM